MKGKSESEVAQSCPTPRDPMDCSLPGSSVCGICQARVLEWVAIAFSEVTRCSCQTRLLHLVPRIQPRLAHFQALDAQWMCASWVTSQTVASPQYCVLHMLQMCHLQKQTVSCMKEGFGLLFFWFVFGCAASLLWQVGFLQFCHSGAFPVAEHGLLSAEPQQLGLFAMWHVGPQFPNQGSNPSPLQWKHGILITELPCLQTHHPECTQSHLLCLQIPYSIYKAPKGVLVFLLFILAELHIKLRMATKSRLDPQVSWKQCLTIQSTLLRLAQE